MYICNSCGHTFSKHKFIKNGGGDVGEDWAVCPECGDDDYDEARECTICGTIKSDVEMCVNMYTCTACMNAITEKAMNVLGVALSHREYKAFSKYYELNNKIV